MKNKCRRIDNFWLTLLSLLTNQVFNKKQSFITNLGGIPWGILCTVSWRNLPNQ